MEDRLVRFKEDIYNPTTGKKFTEVDVEVPEAIIESKVGTGGDLDQLNKLLGPLVNPTGNPVIIYAPDFYHATRPALARGAYAVVKNEVQLLMVLDQLK